MASTFGIMATFIESFAYGTNLASSHTAHVINDAYTFTLADSFTDTFPTSSTQSSWTPSISMALYHVFFRAILSKFG